MTFELLLAHYYIILHIIGAYQNKQLVIGGHGTVLLPSYQAAVVFCSFLATDVQNNQKNSSNFEIVQMFICNENFYLQSGRVPQGLASTKQINIVVDIIKY